MRDQTCEERIDEQLAGRVSDLEAWAAAQRGEVGDFAEIAGIDPDEIDEERAQEWIWELPLAVTLNKVVRVDLSTGGPADFIELHYTADDWRPFRITYHFKDWFDGAVRTVEYGTPAFAAIEAAFGNLIETVQG